MLYLISKSFAQLRNSVSKSSQPLRVYCYFLQFSSLSVEAAAKPISVIENQDSFTISFFINKCGFSPERALSVSKHVNFDHNPNKPDTLSSFLKSQGFTKTQVLGIIRKAPQIVLSNPESFLPKIEFLRSKGFSESEISALIVTAPLTLIRSLDRLIIPTFNFLSEYIGSDQATKKTIKRHPLILSQLQTHVIPNIEILREAGIPDSRIAFGLTLQPFAFLKGSDNFRATVDEVKKTISPTNAANFIRGVLVMASLSKCTWKKKMEIFGRWGCSEAEVLRTFRSSPYCMSLSEDKIEGLMTYFVKEMGWSPSMLMQTPRILSMSLNKRIIPRCAVYRVLQSKGLIKKSPSVFVLLMYSEKKFLDRAVNFYPEEAPELLKLYNEKLKIPS